MTAPDFMDIAAEVCGVDDRKHVAALLAPGDAGLSLLLDHARRERVEGRHRAPGDADTSPVGAVGRRRL